MTIESVVSLIFEICATDETKAVQSKQFEETSNIASYGQVSRNGKKEKQREAKARNQERFQGSQGPSH